MRSTPRPARRPGTPRRRIWAGRCRPVSTSRRGRPRCRRAPAPPPPPPPAPPPRGARPRPPGSAPARPPVADLVETVAEKLSRFRRTMLGRDVYDLASVARLVNPRLPLLRETLCYKAYFDRVEENRLGPVPFAGGVEFRARHPGGGAGGPAGAAPGAWWGGRPARGPPVLCLQGR